MKKIIAVITLISFLFTSPLRVEANPGALIVGGVALGAMLLSTAAVNYYKPVTPPLSGAYSAAIDASANIGRVVYSGWKEFSDYQIATMYNKMVTAKIAFSDLKSKILPDQSGYPKLHSALHTSDVLSGVIPYILPNDSIYLAPDSNYYKVTSYYNQYWEADTFSGIRNSRLCINTGIVSESNPNLRKKYYYNYVNSSAPPMRQRSAAEFGTAISVLNTPYVSDNYMDEIDKYIAEGGSVSYVDTATPDSDLSNAPPFVPPATAVNPNTASQNPAQSITNVTYGATQAAATTKAAELADLKAQRDTLISQGLPLDHPDIVSLDAAIAKAQTAATYAAEQAAVAEAAQDVPLPDATPPELKKINFEKFKELIGILANHWPFTLLASLGALYNQFVVSEPQAPAFDYVVGGQTMHIDLSIFDPLAEVTRAIISVFLVIGVIYFAIRRFTS